MKKILMGLLATGLVSGFTACTDLEPTLYSNLTTDNAYITEKDFNAALVGVYADLNPFPGDAWQYYAGYLVMITDYTTDIGYSTSNDPLAMSIMSYDANNQYLRDNWRYIYQVVSNANTVLQKLNNTNNADMTEEKMQLIAAQLKFLRALAYRDLTDAFGPIPLVTEYSENPLAMRNMPLTSVEEIDAFMLKDLKEALEVLPEKWTGTDLCRATKGAAATLIGQIYMRAHDYQNAKTYIDMVLALRDKGIYTLNPDFKNEWSESNKYDMGSIFCILHENGSNGGEIALHFGPSDHPEVVGRWQFYAVSLPFWRKFDDADPRKQFFYFNYTGGSPRDDKTDYGFYYMMPEKGQNTPPNDTTKLLLNVATKKYTYEMVSDVYYDGRTISIFRLADVILCKAEIENNLNGPGAALPYLNEIRERAGAPAYGKDPRFPVPASKEAMNQAILDERGFELVFEYKRRPDLIRFGKYEETVNAHLKEMDISGTTVTPDMRYLPYPFVETKLNSYMEAENPKRLPK